jgi:dCMP deaminase
MECAKLIIQSGIKRVVFCNRYHNTDGLDLLKRAEIELVFIDPETDIYELQ